jgi:hypothetical protein
LDALTDITSTLTGFFMLQVREELDKEYGLRRFRVVRPDGGAPTIGQILSFELTQASEASATSGSTTTVGDTGIGWTAEDYSGKYGPCYCLITDDAAGAGAAPEGECKRISTNTTALLTVASAFSAAVVVSDKYLIIRIGVAEDGADGDAATEVAGIVMATTVTNDYFCWVQVHGFNPVIGTVATGTAVTAGSMIVNSGSAVAKDGLGTGADEGQSVGVWLGGTRPTDTVLDTWPGLIHVPH